ncbi:hypothetical protein F5Y16DRAFT_360233 [Xylariaceae sp. FL0255]|nr:hypothetical protein F5Y16DRAFT_360233 [Xylariaceae sp. FL0255]
MPCIHMFGFIQDWALFRRSGRPSQNVYKHLSEQLRHTLHPHNNITPTITTTPPPPPPAKMVDRGMRLEFEKRVTSLEDGTLNSTLPLVLKSYVNEDAAWSLESTSAFVEGLCNGNLKSPTIKEQFLEWKWVWHLAIDFVAKDTADGSKDKYTRHLSLMAVFIMKMIERQVVTAQQLWAELRHYRQRPPRSGQTIADYMSRRYRLDDFQEMLCEHHGFPRRMP